MSQSNKFPQSRIRRPFLVVIIAAMAAILMFFMPYVTTVGDFRKSLETMGDKPVYETGDITAMGMMDMSLFEYAKAYYQSGKEIDGHESSNISGAIIYSSLGIMAILVFITVLMKKPVLIFILNICMGGVNYFMHSFVKYNGVINAYRAKEGVAFYAIYFCVAVIGIGAVWMFNEKRKIKKQNKLLSVG